MTGRPASSLLLGVRRALLRSRGIVRRAEEARARRDWTEAERLYRSALRRRPWRAGIQVQIGDMLGRQDRLEEALAAYRDADRRRPGHPAILSHIARVLDQLGRPEQAAAHDTAAMLIRDERRARVDPAFAARLPARRLASARRQADPALPARLRFVNIGTTGICNASCIHCPTGKAATAHVPRVPMSPEMFRSIIDGIEALALPVTGQIAFGLFGDGLADPHVLWRARYARERLPDTVLSVNTNGAAYNGGKHAALFDVVDKISLHCESLEADTYGRLMAPLRLERVRPRYEALLAAFPGKVLVSVPVSRANLSELRGIREWFLERGAAQVEFDPLSSRCARDQTVFRALAIAPMPIRCGPDVLEDLIVDCDGRILICCQDFERAEAIGSLAGGRTLEQALAATGRARTRAAFAAGRHDGFETCRRCVGDLRGGDWDRVVGERLAG